MKTLIINGSPRKNGDTITLLNEVKKYLKGDIEIIDPYFDNIKPCIDCRLCFKDSVCHIKDDMEKIYNDDFDNVIIASPIYNSSFPGPLISLSSRFQCRYVAKRFLKNEVSLKPKRGILIIVGGGNGEPNHALKVAKWMFKNMNATFDSENDLIKSLNTDNVSAYEDIEAKMKIKTLFSKI